MDEKESFSPIEVMRRLFEKDYENKVCVECKCPMPSYVSINNSILLCDRCADRHMKLGYNVSYIRNLASNWDAYLYAFLDRGGNSRFIRLSKKYGLDDIPIEEKFTTRILEYYRLLIKSEVLADAPPFEIPYEVAKDHINNSIEYFPEFKNYQIYEGNIKIEKKNRSGYIEAFRFVGSGLGSLATYLGSKYQEYDMNNKIIKGGAATLKGLAVTGKFLYDTSKPVFKYVGIKAIQGIGYLCNKAVSELSDNEEDDEEEEEEKQTKKKGDKKEKKNKKKKGKKKIKDKEEENKEKNEINNNQDNNNLKEGDYIFEPCIDFPTFESINKVNNPQDNNNIINNNFNINNFNNIVESQFNQNNNVVIKPEYVIPPGLDSSSHENSIVGEKNI